MFKYVVYFFVFYALLFPLVAEIYRVTIVEILHLKYDYVTLDLKDFLKQIDKYVNREIFPKHIIMLGRLKSLVVQKESKEVILSYIDMMVQAWN